MPILNFQIHLFAFSLFSFLQFKKTMLQVSDPSRLVKLHYTVQYVECDLADKRIECKPVLNMYLSTDFVRDLETGGVSNIHLDEDDLSKEYSGTLIGTLQRKYRDISPTAGIGLTLYAIHRNDRGVACYVNCGVAKAMFGEIFKAIRAKGKYDEMLPLIMRTVLVAGIEPVKKSVIRLIIHKIDMGPAVKLSPTASCLQAPIGLIEQGIADYVQKCMQLESSMPDLLPNTDRIRMPYDLSEVGIESTGQTFLPSAAFAIQETPKSNPQFWLNAYERVMARKNMTVQDYNDFDTKEKARTLAQILCYPVQCLDYIGDAVELSNRNHLNEPRRRVGIDEWSTGMSNAIDCEDAATKIKIYHQSLNAAQFDALDRKYSPLIEMQQISRQYYFLLTLAVVHGAKIGDQEGWGAHMVGSMISKQMVCNYLQKTAQGRILLEQMQPAIEPVGRAGNSSEFENLPFLVCEGTGPIDPIGMPVEESNLLQQRQVAMNMQSMAAFKSVIPRVEGKASTFYHAYLSTMQSELFDIGINVGGMVFATIDENNQLRRGALFTDVINSSANIALVPQPPIPASTMQVIQEAIKISTPPLSNYLDDAKPLAEPNKHLDKFCQAVCSFKRSGPDPKFHPSIDKYARPHHLSENVANYMIADAAKFPNLYHAAYEVEHITNQVYLYRIRLWVAPTNA